MTIRIFSEAGPLEVEGTALKHCAFTTHGIIHLATGLTVVKSLDADLARHLDKTLRWVWLDQQPFGVIPTGRGATLFKKAVEAAVTEYRSR